MNFAQRLKAALEASGLSQAELARRIGVSQPTVSAWLGGADPKVSHYHRLIAELPEAAMRVDHSKRRSAERVSEVA